jgi:hypothetical protein
MEILAGFVVSLLVGISAYSFVLGREKSKQNKELKQRIRDLSAEMREWQNLTLEKRGQSTLFEESYEVDREKIDRPGPKFVTRQELIQRDYDNQVKQGRERADNAKTVRPAREPIPKTGRQPAPVKVVVEQAQEIIDSTRD